MTHYHTFKTYFYFYFFFFFFFFLFGTELHRQIVGILMGTNCAPLVAILFLFCFERDFIMSLSDDTQADIIEAFNSTSRYLDGLLNIDNRYFEGMVTHIYPTELQLNKASLFGLQVCLVILLTTMIVKFSYVINERGITLMS